MTALRDEQITKHCKGFKVKQQSFKLSVVELDAVVIISAETRSKMVFEHLNTIKISDVDRTLCKKKETILL